MVKSPKGRKKGRKSKIERYRHGKKDNVQRFFKRLHIHYRREAAYEPQNYKG